MNSILFSNIANNRKINYISSDIKELNIVEDIKEITVLIPTKYYCLLLNPNDDIIEALLFSNQYGFLNIYNDCILVFRNKIKMGDFDIDKLNKLLPEIKMDICNINNFFLKNMLSYILNLEYTKYINASYFTYTMKLFNKFVLKFPTLHIVTYCGSIECFQYFYENNYIFDQYICAYMVSDNNFELLKYAHKLLGNKCPLDTYTCSTAAKYKNLEILKYLFENKVIWDDYTFENACKNKDTDIIKFMISNNYKPNNEYTSIYRICFFS